MANWYSISCNECGDEVRVCEDWEHPPRFCKPCREERANCWYDIPCEDCGGLVHVNRDWDRVPKYCKNCREERAAHWFEKSCAHCGATMHVCRDWDIIPDYHKECAWTEITCELCVSPLRIHRGWERPPKFHNECWRSVAPKRESCSQCGGTFTIPTGTQIFCKQNGYELSRRCPECKHDALLIKGAVGALRDEFPFPLETSVEQRGLIFTDKVAVVRNRRTDEGVAEVTTAEGIFSTRRVAVATEIRSGEVIGKTRDGIEGVFFPKRTADTYDARSGRQTHRTKMVENGIISPECVAETRRTDGDEKTTITRMRGKDIVFRKTVAETDRE